MSISRWYNNVDDSGGTPDKSEIIAQGLQTALQLGSAIKTNREASGAAEMRRQRIAACGRKPIFGFGKRFRKRKDDYNKCVAEAQRSSLGSQSNIPTGSGYQEPTSNTRTYVFIGIGILVVGTAAYFIFKNK